MAPFCCIYMKVEIRVSCQICPNTPNDTMARYYMIVYEIFNNASLLDTNMSPAFTNYIAFLVENLSSNSNYTNTKRQITTLM